MSAMRGLWLLVLLCAIACKSSGSGSRSPDRADRPEDSITYRPLAREDFKASKPPPDAGSHGRTGGRICTSVEGAVQPRAEGPRTPTPGAVYTAHINRAHFEVVMDRQCSWIDPSLAGDALAYVLEHEQTHFAINEVEIRRLNAAVTARGHERFTGSSPEEAMRKAYEVVDQLRQETLRVIEERNHQFDSETSFGFKPEAQKAWVSRIARELEELGAP